MRTLACLALLALACSSTPDAMREMSEEYRTVWGRLASPPELQSRRLFLYVRTTLADGQEVILVCVAENREKEGILAALADKVVIASEAGKPLALIGTPIEGAWREYAKGVDFELYAVGYYNPRGEKYQTVITVYGTRLRDFVRSASWSDFLKMVGGKAVDVGKKAF